MHLDLTEWQRASAGADHRVLEGLFLDDRAIQDTIRRYPLGDRLRVSECRHGLVVEARQHVGVLQLGPLRISIRPKMRVRSLWNAVSYALGLDGITFHDATEIDLAGDFADLLARMVLRESERLWRTGIRRGYRATSEWLAAPRGRPDLVALARSGPLTRAALPCTHHAFTADVVENQVVLAGLALAAGLSTHLPLRSALHRARQQWVTVCSNVQLTAELLDEADRSRNRLSKRYTGIHRLIRLLYERSGHDDDNDRGSQRLPGHLWNMARVFERFVARFLTVHLPDHEVVTQGRLSDLYQVVVGRPGLATPQPRPDLVVRHRSEATTLGVFDTKYRDLWETKLPPEILYQMSVYALGWGERSGLDVPAVVLYPAAGASRPDCEIRLQVEDGRPRRIILRAVDWSLAADLVAQRQETQATRLARRWIGIADPSSG